MLLKECIRAEAYLQELFTKIFYLPILLRSKPYLFAMGRLSDLIGKVT